jgi:hypothetical protein
MARNLFRNGPLCPEGQTDRESKRQETNIVQQAFIVADTALRGYPGSLSWSVALVDPYLPVSLATRVPPVDTYRPTPSTSRVIFPKRGEAAIGSAAAAVAALL